MYKRWSRRSTFLPAQASHRIRMLALQHVNTGHQSSLRLVERFVKEAVTSGRFKSVDEVYRASVAVHTVMYGFRGKESAECQFAVKVYQ